jgi:hypothetical protein
MIERAKEKTSAILAFLPGMDFGNFFLGLSPYN